MSGYTPGRRLYLNAEGKVVEADDPTRTELLVGEAGSIPMARARELGLVTDEDEKGKAPVDNKAKAAPANKVNVPTDNT